MVLKKGGIASTGAGQETRGSYVHFFTIEMPEWEQKLCQEEGENTKRGRCELTIK